MSSLKPMTPAEDRAFHIHYARVLLNQCRHWRHWHADHARLLNYAGEARRDAAALSRPVDGDLFADQLPADVVREMERVAG